MQMGPGSSGSAPPPPLLGSEDKNSEDCGVPLPHVCNKHFKQDGLFERLRMSRRGQSRGDSQDRAERERLSSRLSAEHRARCQTVPTT